MESFITIIWSSLTTHMGFGGRPSVCKCWLPIDTVSNPDFQLRLQFLVGAFIVVFIFQTKCVNLSAVIFSVVPFFRQLLFVMLRNVGFDIILIERP